jgi:D-glycero-D-manno-heptose 1,7-bisphosphate phosphatase
MNKCVFLDRDGVINEERGTYTYKVDDFKIIPGVKEALSILNKNGYLLIVVYMMKETGHLINKIYYASYYPDFSNSLLRKPDSLMFEKAMAKFNIDPDKSWMVGNSDRDLVPAVNLGIRTIYIGDKAPDTKTDFIVNDLMEATEKIISH